MKSTLTIGTIGTKGSAIPGFNSPGVGLDEPYAMLDACHERVERTLRLLARIVPHVSTHGIDAKAQSAAVDVLRYFDIAAPLHHGDEELHVFPLLLQQNDAMTTQFVKQMLSDHEQMSELWAALRTTLVEISAHNPANGVEFVVTEAFEQQIATFAALYAEHLKTESEILFPAAAQLTTVDALHEMSDDMKRRRTTP
ncbi:MAG: hemerythrin domain-containing protein [Casimicrobium sp.]|jgi:hemerythrin-like domain-containing protein